MFSLIKKKVKVLLLGRQLETNITKKCILALIDIPFQFQVQQVCRYMETSVF